MKIAVIGDRHISFKHPCVDEALRLWDYIIDDAIAQGVDGFLCLGDVGEVGMTPEEVYQIGLRYQRMGSQGWVYEVEGNHGVRLGLRWASLLGVTVADDAFLFCMPGDSGVAVLLAPYCRRGFPPYEQPQEDPVALMDAYAASATYLGSMIQKCANIAHSNGDVLIVAGHWTPAGFSVGPSEYELTGGKEMIVPLELLAPADLVVVGHIHQAQSLANVVGVGSIFRTTFAERDQQKSYTIVTIDGGHVSSARHVVPARQMVQVDVSGPNVAETVSSLLGDRVPKDVKLVIHAQAGDQTVYAELTEPLMQMPGHYTWEIVREHVTRSRAPEIEQSVSIVDDFAVWLRVTYPDLPAARRESIINKVGEI